MIYIAAIKNNIVAKNPERVLWVDPFLSKFREIGRPNASKSLMNLVKDRGLAIFFNNYNEYFRKLGVLGFWGAVEKVGQLIRIERGICLELGVVSLK